MPNEVMVEVDGRTLKISNLDKVLYPETGTTKGEVLHYYAQIAPVLLPHLADRAVTRIRWPNGTAQSQFFEKNALGRAPSGCASVTVLVDRVAQAAGHHRLPGHRRPAALTYLANLASLELHVHQWRFGANNRPKNPDRMVVDLDPGPGAGLHAVLPGGAAGARPARPTSGSSCAPDDERQQGPAPLRPMPGSRTPTRSATYAQEDRAGADREHGDLVVSKMTKNLRPGKVFLDWSQNTAAKTTIAPYSLRGRGASVRRRAAHVGGGRGRGGRRRGDRAPGARGGARPGSTDQGDIFGDLLGGDR